MVGTATPALAQSLAELVQQAWDQKSAGDPGAALATFERVIALLQQSGAAQPGDLAFVLNEKSVVQRAMGAAEPAHDAAAAAVELLDAQGQKDAVLVSALINQGLAAQDLGLLVQAYGLQQRAVRLGQDLGRIDLAAAALGHMAAVALAEGRYLQAGSDAEAAFALLAGQDAAPETLGLLHHLRAKSLLARRSPGPAAEALAAVGDLARLPPFLALENRLLQGRVQIQQARPDLALTLLQGVADQAGTVAPDLWASALYNLAEVDFSRGRYAEAEAANQQAEAAYRAVFGDRHPVIGQIRHRQAVILQQVGDLDLALVQFDAALALLAQSVGTDHPLWWATAAERSRTLSRLGRHDEALAAARAVLDSPAIRSGELGASRILALAALGLALKDAGDSEAAMTVLEQVRTARRGAEFSITDEPPGLNALAELYLGIGRADKALQAADLSIDILARMQATSVDSLGEARRIRAEVAAATADPGTALRLARENVSGAEAQLIELARTASYATDFAPVALRKQLAQALALMTAAPDVPRDEIFRAAQLVHLNEASRATNGLLKVIAAQSPATADALRERREVSDAIGALSGLVAQGTADRASLDRLVALRAQKAALDRTIDRLSPDLERDLTPASVPLAEVQQRLQPGEALWLHAVPGATSYLFLITADQITFAQTGLGAEALDTLVRRLRLTLDQGTGAGLIPFDFATAALIYEGLFQPFERQLAQLDRLVLVPDGAAQQVSLATLVRSAAPTGLTPEGADARFLGLTHALAVVPSVSSFVALDSAGQPAPQAKPFFGFGDPVLKGDGTGFRGSPIDRLTGVARAGAMASLFEPLPETALELRQMAQVVPAAQRRLFFGARATETTVKQTPIAAAGTMAFATHAIVSGDFDYLSEPALVLTPPGAPSILDDGLLTVSEIARLALEVDLVILSACNTGSPSGRSGAPGLTGLAAGFFRAGARSLVVSHWTILSITSVLLMPTFFEGMAGDQALAPSEAMRRAMVGLSRRTEDPGFAHPAVWGPFVVVGRR